jgi:hypothetical protein
MWEIFVHGLVFYYCLISITVITNTEKLKIRVKISLLSAFTKSIKSRKNYKGEEKGHLIQKAFRRKIQIWQIL